ncbi:MAG: TonB family protein [Burkholderiales bacterium]|nr:TonB family protein [Burkholderiales bacterium]MDP2399640.1 TonB family protein [Burkholderiales bacterium]
MSPKPLARVLDLPRRAKHPRRSSWASAVDRLDARVAEMERRIADFDRRYARMTVRTRFGAAGTVSFLLHAFVIFGLSFTVPELRQLQNTAPPLEVVLVNAKSPTKPAKSDALAQHSLDGGGNVDTPQRAQSPLPAITRDNQTAELQLAQKRVAELEREARELLTKKGAKSEVVSSPDKPAPQASETAPTVNATDLVQRSLAIARLEAQISKDWNAYQERPRRKFIGARTQEYRFARYVEDWRQKIERIGELNYPQAAREQRVYGSLVATVSIKANGSLERVQIDRSSGSKLLDEATVRIVTMAAPYSAFPENIARDTDILHITRTWTFTRADQFVSQ